MSGEAQAAEAADDDLGTDYTAESAEENTDLEASFDDLLAEERAAGKAARESEEDAELDAADDGGEADEKSVETKDEKKAAEETPPRKEERLVRRLQQSEAENVELRRQLKEAREAPQQSGFSPTGDITDDVLSLAQHYAGEGADPTKVQAVLRALGIDIIAELRGDDNDPELRARREARRAGAKHREVQRQIDELKAQNAAKDRALKEQDFRNAVKTGLDMAKAAEEYPYLYAAEDDVVAEVTLGVRTLCESGYRITDDASALDAIEYVCKTLDADHRRTAERLGKVGGKSAAQPNQQQTETHAPRRDGAAEGQRGRDQGRPKTVTASGAGTRQAPRPAEASDEDPFEALLKEEQLERRRQAAKQRAGR